MHISATTSQPFWQRLQSLLMAVLLLWLTVSTPFVYEAQQDVATAQGIADEDGGNPLSGTNEEKGESGVNSLSEFLHEVHHYQPQFSLVAAAYKCHPNDIYAAFHPELLSPPPEGSI